MTVVLTYPDDIAVSCVQTLDVQVLLPTQHLPDMPDFGYLCRKRTGISRERVKR